MENTPPSHSTFEGKVIGYMAVVFGYLCISSIRMLPYFAMFACFPAAFGLGQIIKVVISRKNLELLRKASLGLCIREKNLNLVARVFTIALIVRVVHESNPNVRKDNMTWLIVCRFL